VATSTNALLADLQVRCRDGGSGETVLTDAGITCDAGVTEDNADTAGWDDTSTYAGIPINPSPKTITCTIVIDP
jgi:hypothetical protein